MTTHSGADRARHLVVQAGRAARRSARQLLDDRRDAGETAHSTQATTPTPRTTPSQVGERRPDAVTSARLSPAGALRENGFVVFRNLFTPAECATYASAFRREAGITTGVKYTRVDAANNFATAREILLEGRIVEAVRSSLGQQPRYLQVGDLHYLHDTAMFHRDSVHRALDASQSADWQSDRATYGVVKAILYLESDNAAMGIIAGSHADPKEIDRAAVKALEDAGQQIVVGAHRDPNLRLTAAERALPLAWKAEVGDVLVFDERMYHAGRRVDDGIVTTNREAPKLTLSQVFGTDNEHSERLYSYFRYIRRELNYRDLADTLVAELEQRHLVLDRGWGDFYREHPEDVVHVHLQGGTTMDDVRARYGLVGTG